MKELFAKKDLISAAHLDKMRLQLTAGLLMRLLRFNELNTLYDEVSNTQGIECLEKLLRELRVSVELGENDLANIPKEGSFVIVANHPFGMLDGIVLIHTIAQVRPDIKVMANLMLSRIEPLQDFFIPVNPFENATEMGTSLSGVKRALEHLAAGHPLGLFPAGEVSAFQPELGTVADRDWQPVALKIIRKAHVPIVPIYFHGSNSLLFHLLGTIHPSLRTMRIPAEFLKKKGVTVRMRVGKAIGIKDQADFPDTESFGKYLRARVYALGEKVTGKKQFLLSIPKRLKEKQAAPQPIVPPVPPEVLAAELGEQTPIHLQKNFALYIEKAEDIPNTIREIGRLREVTFREVGEGTNLESDLDEYDTYYHHLVMWDVEAKRIVGSYRLGKGKEILEKYGRKGFYIQSLFKLDEEMEPTLRESIELGRSFIAKDYQRNPLPLFMLWRGIMYFLLDNPEYTSLIGPVSISNNYSMISKSLLIAFIKKYYYDNELAQYVHPRKDFRVKARNVDIDALLANNANDLNKLDKTISDIEPSSYKMPVLLKKYIKQNAKIIGFNIDPAFNDVLDGLILLRLSDVPEDMLDGLKKEMNLDDKH